jgi:hypothetical protein
VFDPLIISWDPVTFISKVSFFAIVSTWIAPISVVD